MSVIEDLDNFSGEKISLSRADILELKQEDMEKIQWFNLSLNPISDGCLALYKGIAIYQLEK